MYFHLLLLIIFVSLSPINQSNEQIINHKIPKQIMRKMKLMLLCLLMPMIALADNWDAATYQQIEKSVQEPTFANRSFLITKYGAS